MGRVRVRYPGKADPLPTNCANHGGSGQWGGVPYRREAPSWGMPLPWLQAHAGMAARPQASAGFARHLRLAQEVREIQRAVRAEEDHRGFDRHRQRSHVRAQIREVLLNVVETTFHVWEAIRH